MLEFKKSLLFILKFIKIEESKKIYLSHSLSQAHMLYKINQSTLKISHKHILTAFFLKFTINTTQKFVHKHSKVISDCVRLVKKCKNKKVKNGSYQANCS